MSVRARYYPAALQLPGEARVRRKQFVILADGEHSGLHVWSQPRDTPDVHLEVDWSATTVPVSDRQARNGVTVTLTDGGIVVITAGGACKCGALGRWAGPVWATSVRAGAR